MISHADGHLKNWQRDLDGVAVNNGRIKRGTSGGFCPGRDDSRRRLINNTINRFNGAVIEQLLLSCHNCRVVSLFNKKSIGLMND